MVLGSIETRVAPALTLAGLLLAALSVLDSFRLWGSLYGTCLLLLALAIELLRRRPWRRYAAALVLTLAYAASAHTLIEFRADSASYFAYLRSVTFDGDLDFRNEWAALVPNLPPRLSERQLNVFSAGPAVVWAPFYWTAHAYVRLDRALGREIHEADGYSLPYRRATALGTVTVVVIGAMLLGILLAREFGARIALLSVAGAALASPVIYYTFYVPAMSHGVSFGLACTLLWALDRARRAPGPKAWILVGALFGLLVACRWQAALYGILIAAVAFRELRRHRSRAAAWMLASAGAALLAFSPQMIAWKIGFDRFILIPQGRGFLDLGSPHWLQTLVSADHGFFNWTPLMLFGFAGLPLGLRRNPALYAGALVVFAATVWVNGSVPVHDWAAGDAFGGRRYTLVVPLMAAGLACGIEASVRLVRRAPLLVPAAVIAALVGWNLGFVSHFRARKYPEMAPLDRLASDQARSLRLTAQDVLGAIAGTAGHAFAYEVFSAEYMYTGFNRSGSILLRSADDRYLLHGWHTPSRRIARRTFRRALYPEACVRIPLEAPFDLRVVVSARAPEGATPQQMTVAVNGTPFTSAPLATEWRDVKLVVPEDALKRGENALCLRFSNALPADERGRRIAAEVEKVQLP